MAVSRPILLALAGLVLVVGAFVATRGAGSDDGGSEPAPQAPAAKPSSAPADESPPADSAPGRSADKPASGKAEGKPGETTIDKGGAARGPSLLNRPGPARLARALARGDLVVLFVRQPGAADDRATAKSVAALRGKPARGVTVASVSIREVPDYSAITGRAGVTQAPAIVLAKQSRRGSKGLLLEGYTDPASLRQHVADALK